MAKPHFVKGKWAGPFVLPDIRESVGLDSAEKALLYDLASHHDFTETGTIKRILQRTGMGPNVFRRVRVALEELNLIRVELKSGSTYSITLNVSALVAYPKAYTESNLDPATRREQVAARVAARRGTPITQRTPSIQQSRKKNNAADKYAREYKPRSRTRPLPQSSQPELNAVGPKTVIKPVDQAGWYEPETSQRQPSADDGTED